MPQCDHLMERRDCADCEPRRPGVMPASVADARPGPWFTAAYDGDCSGCDQVFWAGDEIRADGEGGWQARCCGRDSTPDPGITLHRQFAAGHIDFGRGTG